MTTAVIGAGVVGVTTAWTLCQTGRDIVLIDQHNDAGMGATMGNAGLLVPSQAEPWNQPGVILRALWWLLRGSGPFEIKGMDAASLRWLWQFAAASLPQTRNQNSQRLLEMAENSLAMTREIAASIDHPLSGNAEGVLTLLRRQDPLAAAARLNVYAQSLSPEEVVELEPALAPVAHELSGGILTNGDYSGDAAAFTRALLADARAKGVSFQGGQRISTIERSGAGFRLGGIAASEVVIAAGAQSAGLAATIGVSLPIQPVWGISMTLDGGARFNRPVRDPAYQVALTPYPEKLRIAGKAVITKGQYRPGRNERQLLQQCLQRLLPAISPSDLDCAEIWAGARPMTPNGLPVLGATTLPGLFVNSGQGHIGWTLACASAAILAEHMGEPG